MISCFDACISLSWICNEMSLSNGKLAEFEPAAAKRVGRGSGSLAWTNTRYRSPLSPGNIQKITHRVLYSFGDFDSETPDALTAMDAARRKQEEAQVKRFKAFVDSAPENQVCCDCGARGPRWASTNLGAVLCLKCAGFHRALGTHISKVKSLSLDIWPVDMLEHFLTLGGNKAVNNLFLPRPDLAPPCPVNDDLRMEQYIRDKYERKRFMGNTEGLVHQGAHRTVHHGHHGQHHKPATPSHSELKHKYLSHLSKLSSMGFTDEDRNIQLLVKFGGSLNDVVDHLLSNATNGSSHQARPSLPPPPQSSRSRARSPSPSLPPPVPSKTNLMDDIFGDFISAPAPAPTASQSAPAPAPAASNPAPRTGDARTAQIMSLYNTSLAKPTPPSVPSAQPQSTNPFANWPATAGSTQPQGGMQTNGFNQQTPVGNGNAAWCVVLSFR